MSDAASQMPLLSFFPSLCSPPLPNAVHQGKCGRPDNHRRAQSSPLMPAFFYPSFQDVFAHPLALLLHQIRRN